MTFLDWQVYNEPRKGRKGGGVAICINSHTTNFTATRCAEYDEKNYEAVAVSIHTDANYTFNLLSPYIPPEETEQLEHLTKKVYEKQNANRQKLIIMGDLNAKSLEWNNDKTNKAGELVEDLLTKTGMLCVNDGQPTRRNTSSVIDLVLITPEMNKVVQECTTLAYESIRSDHICVLVELDTCKKHNNPRPKRKVWQLNKVDWNNWKQQSEKNMQKWLENNPVSDDVDTVYQSLKKTIDETMQEVINQKEVKERKSTKPPWWNSQVSQAKKYVNYSQRQYKRRNIPQNKTALVTAEQEYEKQRETAMDEWSTGLIE